MQGSCLSPGGFPMNFSSNSALFEKSRGLNHVVLFLFISLRRARIKKNVLLVTSINLGKVSILNDCFVAFDLIACRHGLV